MLKININLDLEDFEDINFKNEEDKKYILWKYKELIENEEDNLEELTNQAIDSIWMINIINDNRGELCIQNEDWTNEYFLWFYADITI